MPSPKKKKMDPKLLPATASKLCCMLAARVRCGECREQWCEACWFPLRKDGFANANSHTTGTKAHGGWGKCPKVNKYVMWSMMEGDDMTLCIRPYSGPQIT